MGTWGYGPFSNDDAGNLIAKLTREVDRVANARSDSTARHRYHSARVIAQLMVISHKTDILGGSSLEPAVRALARMRSDTDWLATFREPKKIVKALTEELATVLGRMRACKTCRKRKKVFAELVELAKAADAVKPPKRAPGPKVRRLTKAQMKAWKTDAAKRAKTAGKKKRKKR